MPPPSDWSSNYIAVDWGTTNRRAYRIANGGAVTDFEDSMGILAVAQCDFPDAVAHIRERLGNHPMLLAGMIGSNRGWHHAPYVSCPAGARQLAATIRWVDERTGIVPGVCQSSEPDVMRGEEVQALGAWATGRLDSDTVFCFPGTHSKWVKMANGDIDGFHTAMTGELFGLLKEHSLLADQLQGQVKAGPSFDRGVADGLSGASLLSALFAVRARYLLQDIADDDASYASGLLIGTDVGTALKRHPDAGITFVGRPDLCALYARAAGQAGREHSTIDGDMAFVAGMQILVDCLP